MNKDLRVYVFPCRIVDREDWPKSVDYNDLHELKKARLDFLDEIFSKENIAILSAEDFEESFNIDNNITDYILIDTRKKV